MPIRIASAERGGTFWTQALALATVLEREATLAPVSVIETKGASVETAHRMASGEADLGFMAANWVPRACAGEAPFKRPLDLRIVAPMNAGPLFFIARAESAIGSVAELAGKRVVFGPETSGMAQHARLMLGLLGIAVEPVFLDFAAGGAAVIDGAADAQLQCPIPNTVMTALDERAGLKVLPYGEAALATLLASVPYYRRVTMRAGALRAVTADTAQVGVLNLLVTHATAPIALTYRVAQEIASATAELPRLNPLFAGIDELFQDMSGIAAGPAPLHEGAARAYRERGLLR